MKVINSGKATGYIYNFKKTVFDYKETVVDVKKEETLFFNALKSYEKELSFLKDKTTGNFKDIIEIYIAFLNDEVVIEKTCNEIKNNKISAGLAYSKVILKYIAALKDNKDLYLKDRANDLLDIKENVLKQMYQEQQNFNFEKPTILIVDNLTVSLVLNLPKQVKAIIAKTGSDLSHSTILMKEKNIPFVISEKYNFKDDEIILINTKKRNIKIVKSLVKRESFSINTVNPLKTNNIKLYLNLSSLEQLNYLSDCAICGIGLLRSEHLFINELKYPKLNKQEKCYKKVLAHFYNKEVTIRLFDFKKDKTPFLFIKQDIKEFNFFGPLKEIYQEQIEALMLANESFGNLKIVIPMIKSIKEYNAVKNYLEVLKEKLNLKQDIPKLGVMLETKEALNNINDYLIVDFINIGTNDLINELYNINREKSLNNKKYIKKIIKDLKPATEMLRKNKISYCFCGDIASNTSGLKKLLKNGEKCFSITLSFLEEAVKIINNF